MKCPYCVAGETKVTDKRDSGSVNRRRRECLKCGRRFTTYERVELDLSVIKKDGKREAFNRSKIYDGVSKSLEKRPFSGLDIEGFVNDIEAKIYRMAKDKDIKSSAVGEIVMMKLKKIDKVAYIRFASVYRDFADLDEFKQEIKKLK
ncbi:MAG: transcriptional regulator NrdR [Nitrososphaerales archaeon]|jgi:transcriptional repressor NrdR|nr:transcriptional regulator NrdR [Nitrososphaerales archaeon]